MASRAVAKELTKCRSGRDVDRTGRIWPSLRGGKCRTRSASLGRAVSEPPTGGEPGKERAPTSSAWPSWSSGPGTRRPTGQSGSCRSASDSFATLRLAIARVLARWLPRCPLCHRDCRCPPRPSTSPPQRFVAIEMASSAGKVLQYC